MSDEPDRQDLEDRVEHLESTISQMLPSRRDALKLGGAALVGGAAMSGSASAGTQQAGTIGTPNDPVDVESEDINNADTVTTQDLVVNQNANGPIGPVLESGDNLTVEVITNNSTDGSFVNLYNGSAKVVLGGVIVGGSGCDWLYEFADNTTITKNAGSGATTYTSTNNNQHLDSAGDRTEVDFMPPAKDVIKVDVGASKKSSQAFAAELILKD